MQPTNCSTLHVIGARFFLSSVAQTYFEYLQGKIITNKNYIYDEFQNSKLFSIRRSKTWNKFLYHNVNINCSSILSLSNLMHTRTDTQAYIRNNFTKSSLLKTAWAMRNSELEHDLRKILHETMQLEMLSLTVSVVK
jgi:hypothetical protein